MELLNFKERMKTGEELTIAALGDSLTYGWMVTKGYICFLREMISEKYHGTKINFINSGSPGDTARGGLYRVYEDVLRHKPDLVFVQFGLNDAYTGFTPESFRQHLSSIIEEIKAKPDIEIILLTSVPVKDALESVTAEKIYEMIIQCGEEYNIPVVRVHEYWNNKIEAGVNWNSLVQADGVHPTEEGYRLMAEAVMELF